MQKIVWRQSQSLPDIKGTGELVYPGQDGFAAIYRERLSGVNWVPMWSHKKILFFGDAGNALSAYPFLERLAKNNNHVGFMKPEGKVSAGDIEAAKPDAWNRWHGKYVRDPV